MALLILEIQSSPSPNQNLDSLNLPFFCSLMHWGTALLILDVQSSPSLNQNLDSLNLALFCGLMEQGGAVFILPVDIFLLTFK